MRHMRNAVEFAALAIAWFLIGTAFFAMTTAGVFAMAKAIEALLLG